MGTDEEIERKIYSELGWSYFANGLELIEVLDLSWKKLDPVKDVAPNKLKYDDDLLHIYFIAKCLIFVDTSQMPPQVTRKHDFSNLAIQTTAFLYSTSAFEGAGEGPMALPSDFDDFYWEEIDLTSDIAGEIAEALINDSFEFKEKIVARNGEEAFLKTIKHKKLKQAMTKSWKRNKDSWV